MAWNPSPEVALARDAARKLGANRAIIVYTNTKGQIGYASYGETRSLCAETRTIAEKLYATAFKHFEELADAVEPDFIADKAGEQ